MAIRVGRNASGNCVVFYGQTNPVYFNACLSAEIIDTDYVSVINDIASAPTQQDVTPQSEYEYYRVHFSEWRDKDNGTFADAQAVVDYINLIGNVTDAPASGFVFTAEDQMDFTRDETNTSILFSNGDHHGVNSIKAILKENGHIGLYPERTVDVELYEIPHTSVTINGSSPGNSAATVVNALNALFTVTATSSPIAVPAFTQDGGTEIEWNSAEIITPVGGTVGTDFGYGSTNSPYHGPRVWTTETINEPGEYFTFEVQNLVSSSGALFGFGLYSVDDGDLAEITDSNLSNSGHHGYWYSLWLHNYNGYTAPWTTYGSNSGWIFGPGWSGAANQQFRYADVHMAFRPGGVVTGNALIKVGITDEGFAGIWYYDQEIVDIDGQYGARSNEWILMSRSSTPLPAGEYGLLVKLADDSSVIRSKPQRFATDPAAPTLYYRYAESPNDNFAYPLFASEEEANWVDTLEGGLGTSHTHYFADDLTGTVWYMPDTGGVHTAPSAPQVPGIVYTEIPTEDDPEPLPPAFTDTTLTVDELSEVNYQVSPVDASYTTTISGISNWSLVGGTTLTGTAPEVIGDNVANPSDTTTVTVYRTNSAGTTTGTLTINITNLTNPVTPIAGFHHEQDSEAMVDADTLADGSVVRVQDHIVEGDRIHFESTFMTNSVLAALNSVGDSVAKVYMGILASGANLSALTEADFEFGAMYYKHGTNDYRVRYIYNGSFMSNTGLGSDGVTFSWELLFANGGASQGYELSTAQSSLNPENYYMSQDGGNWSSYYWTGSLPSGAGNKHWHIGVTGTTMDISTTGVDEHTIPTPPVSTNDTSWTKALDFSGSSEHAQMVSISPFYNPMLMDYQSVTTTAPGTAGNTSSDTAARPWATACVFSSDGHNSNQHIWNIGEGPASDADNIYLRIDSSRNLFFGWGRDGALNEYFLSRVGSGPYHGVYVGFNGTRLSGANATPANLAAAFDIRLMFNTGSSTWGFNPNPLAQGWGTWSSNGGRMDRSVTGSLTIGGRGSNRNFHGKVASFVTTTLQRGVAMPDATEIAEMITDPVGWLNDYKVGNDYRPSHEGTSVSNFSINNLTSASATQVYLMGDGTNDSYSNMIRNQVNPNDQNFTKLNMVSMISNDIETVSISGLT